MEEEHDWLYNGKICKPALACLTCFPVETYNGSQSMSSIYPPEHTQPGTALGSSCRTGTAEAELDKLEIELQS
eukprot:256350-Pleurochrysis_carterae.AAC.2